VPLSDFRFAYPWVLAALVLLPLIALVVLRLRPDRLRGGVVLATLGPLRRAGGGRRSAWRRLLLPLRLAGLTLLIVALARPQTVEADARVETQGIDIVLAFDISGSMNEPGLGTRSKMEGAKRALKDFLADRENDRVGMVVFKGESRVMAPLTLDYTALSRMIDDVEKQNDSLTEGTAIGLGVADGVNLLRNSPSKTRIIILATDGENNQNRVTPDQAAAIAEQLRVPVYTIGLVTANARPEATLDEREMRRLSERTGATYTRAANADSLRETYSSITALEKSRFERERLIRYNELAPWLIVPGLALLVLETTLAATWLRRAP
jgi:Ca-activated chloride channel homolog